MFAYKARKYLRRLERDLNQEYNRCGAVFEFASMPDRPIGHGYVDATDDEVTRVRVNAGNLFEHGITGLFSEYHVRDLVKCGIASFHEAAHVCQNKHIEERTDYDVDLAYLVQNYNSILMDDNYEYNPRKIQAEWSGIFGFADWAEKHILDMDLSGEIVDYVNKRRNDKDIKYFLNGLDRELRTLDDVDDVFSEAFKRSKERPVWYQSFHRDNPDFVYKLFEYGTPHMDKWDSIREPVVNASDFRESVRKIAALSLAVHPEDGKAFPCVRDLGISVSREFGQELPETVSSIQNRFSSGWDGKTREYVQDVLVLDQADVSVVSGVTYEEQPGVGLLVRPGPRWTYDVKAAVSHGSVHGPDILGRDSGPDLS